MAQAAKIISSASGQDIKYVDVDREEWVKGVVASGIPAAYGEVLRKLSKTIADNYGSRPTQDVHTVTGREPIPVLPHLACSTFALHIRKEKQKEHMFSSGAFHCIQFPFPCLASR